VGEEMLCGRDEIIVRSLQYVVCSSPGGTCIARAPTRNLARVQGDLGK